MASMPIRRPLPPSTVRDTQNGMLDRALLAPVDGNMAATRLLERTLVAPAMTALHEAAARAGFILATTGRYRPLQQQWDYFGGVFGRYEPCTYEEYVQRRGEDKKARRKNTTKIWTAARRNHVIALLGAQSHPIPDEMYWRLINPKSLNSATPGTSNHGVACSDDLGQVVVDSRGRRRVVSLTKACRDWLYEHITEFGFAWETAADPPHVTWFMGDETPPALRRREMELFQVIDNVGTNANPVWVFDEAVFTLDGANAWAIPRATEDAFATIKNCLVLAFGEPKLWLRPVLFAFKLDGPPPVYPAGYTGRRTVGTDFRPPVKVLPG